MTLFIRYKQPYENMNWETYHTKELKEEYLIKFLPLFRFEELVKSGEIWFSRADKFGDKLECLKISDIENNNFNLIESRQKKTLISCWHLAKTESVAMWDTYSADEKNRKNIAIRFKRQVLTKLIEKIPTNLNSSTQFIHGKVQYKNIINYDENRLSKARIKYSAFRKENAFAYESEYRFVIKNVIPYENEGFGYKIGKLEKHDFDIIINPLLEKEAASSLIKEIKELGLANKVQRSKLEEWFQRR